MEGVCVVTTNKGGRGEGRGGRREGRGGRRILVTASFAPSFSELHVDIRQGASLAKYYFIAFTRKSCMISGPG